MDSAKDPRLQFLFILAFLSLVGCGLGPILYGMSGKQLFPTVPVYFVGVMLSIYVGRKIARAPYQNARRIAREWWMFCAFLIWPVSLIVYGFMYLVCVS